MFDDDFFFSTLTGSQEVLSVNPNVLFFDGVGTPDYVQLTASGSWTVSYYPRWMTVSPLSGSGNATLTIDPYKLISGSRSDVVTITSGSLTATISIQQFADLTPI